MIYSFRCLSSCAVVVWWLSLITASPDPHREYLLVGVSGGLQDGFPERHKMDYHYEKEDEVKAILVGKALVRGYKAFLDVMQAGWRQYIDEPEQPLINSNVFASGCYEHANEYWVYLIDSRQVVAVLNHEPRFLSITADTGQIDLTADETSSTVQQLFHYMIQQQNKKNTAAVAIPLVTAVWFQYESHVPSPVIKTKQDGTQITNFPDSLAVWANVSDNDRTANQQEEQSCTIGQNDAQQRYWDGIRIAVRNAEQSLLQLTENEKTYGPPFQCQRKIQFGVGTETARVNTPIAVDQLESMVQSISMNIDFVQGILVTDDSADTTIEQE